MKSQLNPAIPQIVVSGPEDELESRSLISSDCVTRAGLSNLKNSLLYGSGTSDQFIDQYSFSDVSSIISIDALDLNEDSQKAWLGLELDSAKYFLRPSVTSETFVDPPAFDRLEYLRSLHNDQNEPPRCRSGRRASEPAVRYGAVGKARRISDTQRRPSVSWKQELLTFSKPYPHLIVKPQLSRLASMSHDQLPQVEVTSPPPDLNHPSNGNDNVSNDAISGDRSPISGEHSPTSGSSSWSTNHASFANGHAHSLSSSALIVKVANSDPQQQTNHIQPTQINHLHQNGGSGNYGNLLSPNGFAKLSGSSLSSDGSQVYQTPSGSPQLLNHLDNDFRQTLKWISADSVFNIE